MYLWKKEDGIYSLTIPDVKCADGGVYRLNAKNVTGVVSFGVEVKVRAAPKLVKTLKAKTECGENNRTELVCAIAAGCYPAPKFEWYRNGELIDIGDLATFVQHNEDKANTLVIERPSLPLDESRLKFVCSNELGSVESETSLGVFSAPVFLAQIGDAEPYLGQEFEWSFVLDCHPEPKLKVIRADKEINLLKETRIKLTGVWVCFMCFGN